MKEKEPVAAAVRHVRLWASQPKGWQKDRLDILGDGVCRGLSVVTSELS